MNRLASPTRAPFLAVRALALTVLALVAPVPWLAGVVLAQPGRDAPAMDRAAMDPAAMDPADLDAFFAGLVPAQLAAYDVPGAVVTVVHDGEVVFARGYGWADVDARTPVDPEATLFRIGSVTKLFTYTAAMQLVERGALDLGADVNAYLTDVEVPGTFERPVTAAHLMTHTAGFEERVEGLFARDPGDLVPLSTLLGEELPARVRPPGELAAYSNHGVGLLGLVVEEVSGRPWATYVEEEILAPLGMTASTAEQPLPGRLEGTASQGYRIVAGAPQAQPYTLVPLAPAGAMAASGRDMARFMLAHLGDGALGDGALGDARILEEATARRMHGRLFAHDPRLPGIAHGFYQGVIDGTRTLGHDGGMPNFVTRLMLFPDHDAGLFVSFNSATGSLALEELAEAFVRRYLPGDPPEASDYRATDDELARVAGTYLSTRSAVTTRDKLGNLVMTVTATPTEEGLLRITSLARPPATLEPVASGLWRDVDSAEPWVADERDGRRMLFSGNAQIAFRALRWYELPGVHAVAFLASAAILLSVLVVAPFAAVLHRRVGDRPPAASRWGRAILTLAAAALLAYLVAVAAGLANVNAYLFGAPRYLDATSVVAPFAAVLVLAAAAFAALGWRRGLWSAIGRVHYTVAVVAGLVLVAQLAYWNLLIPAGWF